MATARRTAWTMKALSGGLFLPRADYTDSSGVFSFAVLAKGLHMSKPDLLLHFPSYAQRSIAAYLSVDGAAFTDAVEHYMKIRV